MKNGPAAKDCGGIVGGWRGDVEITKAIREAVGPTIDIGADVNSAYDAATAIKACHELAKYDLWFIEEPVYPDDIDGYELIRRSQPIPVAAGESESVVFDPKSLTRIAAVCQHRRKRGNRRKPRSDHSGPAAPPSLAGL